MAEKQDNPFKKKRGNPAMQPGKSIRRNKPSKIISYIRELAREQSEVAISTLSDICQDSKTPPAARVAAASALLDRGYGKPTQYVEDGKNPLDTLSDNEQEALLDVIQSLSSSDKDAGEGTEASYH